MFDPKSGPAEWSSPAAPSAQGVPTTSEAQRELWLACQLGEEASLAYNLSLSLKLEGALDAEALAAAFRDLVARHESLRATFSAEDGATRIDEAGEHHEMQWLDLDAAADADLQLASLHEREVTQPFDLAHGPLVRAWLVRLGATRHEFILTAHHIICDGWSLATLIRELLALYRARVGNAPSALEPAIQYRDYVGWLDRPEIRERERVDRDHWISRLAGTVPVLDLPTDQPRPQGMRSFSARRMDIPIDASLMPALRRRAAGEQVTLFTLLLGAFATLLARLGGNEEVVVGFPMAGQLEEGFSGLVGHCANLLPVRLRVDLESGASGMLRSTGESVMDAREHTLCSFNNLINALRLPRSDGRPPLAAVMFNVSPRLDPRLLSDEVLQAEVSLQPRRYDLFDLSLDVALSGKQATLECYYNDRLFERETVRRWMGMYECLLRGIAADAARPLGQLSLIPDDAMAQLRALQPPSTPMREPSLMHAAFTAQAAREPHRTALCLDDQRMSYGELDARSNRLAHALRLRGVKRGHLVGICLQREPDMLVALIAVLKAGAAYVPLDPDFPAARLAYYAEDAGLALLLTSSSVPTAPRSWCGDAQARVFELDRDDSWTSQPAQSLEPGADDPRAEDPAYVIYTSGSTGKPKGIVVPHGAVANFLQSMQSQPGIASSDRLLAVTTLSFDIAVLELLLPLAVGAEVIIARRDTVLQADALLALLAESGATVMQAVPSMWRVILDSGWQPRPGFKALVGGEGLPPDLARAMTAKAAQVWNMYGPTETTVWSTLWLVDAARVDSVGVSIGQPIDNTTVWILDEHLQQLPVGVPGEICIGGAGVAIGYLHRPELTAERFVTVDIDGVPTRLYRTGDRGRWRNDGLLEHMGRFDFQVKVRGYRIELGEIEARCDEVPGVSSSVVLAREDVPGDVRLVAYLALTPGSTVDRASVREQLRASLPHYMLPQHVVVLPALPLLPNGKIDRKALPAPQPGTADDVSAGSVGAGMPASEPLLSPEQATLAQIWAEALHLNIHEIRASDNFFDLGGDSLLVMRVIQRVQALTGAAVKPQRYVFESLGQLALQRPVAEPAPAPKPPPAPRGLLSRVFGGWGRKSARAEATDNATE
ncbi:Linear gramicidin synthase subunit D [Xylophilus ampelinus]|nr:amino acid adenylation domain-containing protein [Variovorax sp.]VTY34780.1 Linear gramicidin synthase subunit D [Xylophilus ampelinus]